jgi:potassium-dependent mechanosensitive channel
MFASRPLLKSLFAAALFFATLDHSAAQQLLLGPSSPKTTVVPEMPAGPINSVRAENAQELQKAMRKLEAGGAADSAAAQEVAFYQTREAVLSQQEVVEQQIKDLETRKIELEKEQQAMVVKGHAELLTFAELDQLKDELDTEEARLNLISDKLVVTKTGVEKARTALDESEVKRRQSQEERDSGKAKPNLAELTLAADQARLGALLAADVLVLRKRERDRDDLAKQVQTLLVQVRKEQVARMSPLVVMSKSDYQQQLDDIKAKEEIANEWLRTAQSRLQNVNVKLREAQEQLNVAIGDRTIATETLEGQRRAREKLTDEIDCLTQRLQRLAQLRLAWNYRHKISAAKKETPDHEVWGQLKTLQKETKGILGGLAEDMRMEILRMRDLRSSLNAVSKKLEAAENGPEPLQLALNRQHYQLELTLRIHERNLVMIETSRRVHEKLLDEIGLGVETLTAQNLAYSAWHRAERIWKFELATIGSGNGERSITVQKIVTGFGIFMSGWMLSRFFSGLFAVRLLKRFRLSKDATAAIRTLVFYIMLAIVVLYALKMIEVPLTAFTILGGALAIGVGFGSQALINNFIGGLIMLAERPVRLGERITFGNFDGVVEDVGFRCTKLRTQADHLVTIPNSTLVNESIENVDRRRTIRRVMNLQVSYNITQDQLTTAVQSIREILEEKEIRERIHPIVGFEEFTPRVFFTDFNAESLNIQVTYWFAPVDAWAFSEHCERVNLRIMEEFDRLGVEFAFPSKTAFVKKPNKLGGTSYAA